ncbi:hypothetical protein CLOM_g10959, partial [Closterium sp. NIES-68]
LGLSPRPSSPCRPGPAFQSDGSGSSISRKAFPSGGRRDGSATIDRELSVEDPATEGPALLTPPSLPPSLLLPTDCLSVESLGEDSHLLESLGLTLSGGVRNPASAAVAGAAWVDTESRRSEIMQNKIRLLARKAGQLRVKDTHVDSENQEGGTKIGERKLEERVEKWYQPPSVPEQAREQQVQLGGPLVEGSDDGSQHGFKILKEELKFSRYLKIYSRVVQHPQSPRALQDPERAAETSFVTSPVDQLAAPTAVNGRRAGNGAAYGASGARGPIVAACAAGSVMRSRGGVIMEGAEGGIQFQQQQQQEEEAKGQRAKQQKVVEYDIVSSASSHFICVLPYHSATKSVTLLKEYAQGANSLLYTVPCGGLSSSHASLEDCVRSELSEEARLRGGRLVRLIPDDHPGLLEVKWCKNRFTPFLIIDPHTDPTPLPRDPEEFIQVLHMPASDLARLALGGDMMLPSVVTCTMGLQYLRDHHLL